MPTGFEDMHPWMWWLLGLGGVATAWGAVWRIWVRPTVKAVSDAIRAATEIATLLRDVRDFMRDSLPDILSRLDSGAARFEEHEDRLNNLEEAVGVPHRPPKVRDSE